MGWHNGVSAALTAVATAVGWNYYKKEGKRKKQFNRLSEENDE